MPAIKSVQSFKNVTSQVSAQWRTQAPAHICHPTPKMFPPKCPNTLRSVPISVIQLHLAKTVAYDYSSVLFLGTTRGAMYEHLRVVPPGKRLRVPSCTRPEILGSG
jgi:hypothetical protein